MIDRSMRISKASCTDIRLLVLCLTDDHTPLAQLPASQRGATFGVQLRARVEKTKPWCSGRELEISRNETTTYELRSQPLRS